MRRNYCVRVARTGVASVVAGLCLLAPVAGLWAGAVVEGPAPVPERVVALDVHAELGP